MEISQSTTIDIMMHKIQIKKSLIFQVYAALIKNFDKLKLINHLIMTVTLIFFHSLYSTAFICSTLIAILKPPCQLI
ncbi:unnamed protein product [Blepharisma stoltei]|uniref:Uncharacterized protein n=1 Tax=Blepharisma stoltei TaxID=1481888 RepID=A0AAU9JV81_9CILI|nr:unnamed protein product [Blepharisma stoltei]